jgi:hypothetical protein
MWSSPPDVSIVHGVHWDASTPQTTGCGLGGLSDDEPGTPTANLFGNDAATSSAEGQGNSSTADMSQATDIPEQYEPVVANCTVQDRTAILKMYREANDGKLVKVVNMCAEAAHALVQGYTVASGTEMVVANRTEPMPSFVAPGSWLLIRGGRSLGRHKRPELELLRGVWPSMPGNLVHNVYTGCVRYKESRLGSQVSLCTGEQCVGPHCWLFDEWYAFNRLYLCPAVVFKLEDVPKRHTAMLPTRNRNSSRAAKRAQTQACKVAEKEQAAAREAAAKLAAGRFAHGDILADRNNLRREASASQVLRNAAIQVHDKKLGARGLAAMMHEIDKRTVGNGQTLGLKPVGKSTIAAHRRRIDVCNIEIQRRALQWALQDPHARLCITCDNTPDRRGHELHGQVYTVPTCVQLVEDDGRPILGVVDGCPIAVEGIVQLQEALEQSLHAHK